ncbi:MAG: hypothetical protein JEZ02_01685 [Desulfatibacillum sp.]|nr:hypothetical protein [Desulfatibacillum sp.]
MADIAQNTQKCSCSEKHYVVLDGMRFLRTSNGLVFTPEFNPHNRKHSCPDCASCAMCADSRCTACLGQSSR